MLVEFHLMSAVLVVDAGLLAIVGNANQSGYQPALRSLTTLHYIFGLVGIQIYCKLFYISIIKRYQKHQLLKWIYRSRQAVLCGTMWYFRE